MKRLIGLIALLICPFISEGQHWIGIGMGINTSQLKFTDSNGTISSGLKGLPAFSASVLYQKRFSSKAIGSTRFPSSTLLAFGLGFRSAKIKNAESSLQTTWSMQYATSDFKMIRMMNSKHKVNPFFGGGLFADYLIGGTQNIGFEQFDLAGEMKRINLGLVAELGLSYYQAEDSFSTLRLSYRRGLSNLEKDAGQKAYLHTFKVSVSIFFQFKN